jgi:hypothetical protein
MFICFTIFYNSSSVFFLIHYIYLIVFSIYTTAFLLLGFGFLTLGLLIEAITQFFIFLFLIFGLLIASPLICLYLKFSSKNKDGKTQIELILLNALDGEECPICLLDYEESNIIVAFPCHKSHRFHKECATSWLEKHSTCPICRF